MKKNLMKLIIILTMTAALTSCTSSPKKDKNELINNIIIPSFPDPYDADGNRLMTYNSETGKIEIEPTYWAQILKYALDVESAAQALDVPSK